MFSSLKIEKMKLKGTGSCPIIIITIYKRMKIKISAGSAKLPENARHVYCGLQNLFLMARLWVSKIGRAHV